MTRAQLNLFGPERVLPEGFRYEPEIISPEWERQLIEHLKPLPFEEFQFQGYLGKRRVVSFGWKYDFNERELQPADPFPDWLLPLRDLAADFAELPHEAFAHVLITEYAPGAGIGWHRDKGVFGDVVGISLLSPCPFRLRRKRDGGWDRVTVSAEPRSAYLLRGPARTEWEHSIAEVNALRYSLTFRTMRR